MVGDALDQRAAQDLARSGEARWRSRSRAWMACLCAIYIDDENVNTRVNIPPLDSRLRSDTT